MRHYEQYAGPLALEAAGRALEEARLPAREITHLVTVSCTGFSAPGVDIHLIDCLGLVRSTQRTHVGFMGCHGALNGLRVARAITGADPGARVLLCSVELCSVHYYYGWDPQKMVVNAIFADGAGAIVGAADGALGCWRLRANGSFLFPDSNEAMTWTIGDQGFQMTLSKQAPDLIARHLRPWLTAWLDRQGMTLRDIASWAVHPGGPRVLTLVEESLGLPAAANQPAREVLAEHGNMSSATMLFVLDKLRRQNAPRPCLALAFGPGLTVEAAVFE
jgi:predicted naringenin-chalcone synthase